MDRQNHGKIMGRSSRFLRSWSLVSSLNSPCLESTTRRSGWSHLPASRKVSSGSSEGKLGSCFKAWQTFFEGWNMGKPHRMVWSIMVIWGILSYMLDYWICHIATYIILSFHINYQDLSATSGHSPGMPQFNHQSPKLCVGIVFLLEDPSPGA